MELKDIYLAAKNLKFMHGVSVTYIFCEFFDEPCQLFFLLLLLLLFVPESMRKTFIRRNLSK